MSGNKVELRSARLSWVGLSCIFAGAGQSSIILNELQSLLIFSCALLPAIISANLIVKL